MVGSGGTVDTRPLRRLSLVVTSGTTSFTSLWEALAAEGNMARVFRVKDT